MCGAWLYGLGAASLAAPPPPPWPSIDGSHRPQALFLSQGELARASKGTGAISRVQIHIYGQCQVLNREQNISFEVQKLYIAIVIYCPHVMTLLYRTFCNPLSLFYIHSSPASSNWYTKIILRPHRKSSNAMHTTKTTRGGRYYRQNCRYPINRHFFKLSANYPYLKKYI